MNLKAAIIANLDKWFPLPEETKPQPKRRERGESRQRQTAVSKAPQVDYEAWRAGKLGTGNKVKAPRGYGAEWAARLYCERQLERAYRYAYNDYSTRQLRTGSYAHRRRQTVKSTHRQAWEYGIEMAEAVMKACEGEWQGKQDICKDIWGYTSYMLEIAGD